MNKKERQLHLTNNDKNSLLSKHKEMFDRLIKKRSKNIKIKRRNLLC